MQIELIHLDFISFLYFKLAHAISMQIVLTSSHLSVHDD